MEKKYEEEIEKAKKKFKDVICHIEADFFLESAVVNPETPSIPETTFLLLRCSECGKKYCLQVSLSETKFFEIKDEEELGNYIAEMSGIYKEKP